MATRSLTATPDGIERINHALTEKKWSREDLAKECDCSRQPAVKFCSGKSVSKKLFVSFCEALALDWEEIAGLKTTSPVAKSTESQGDINALVETVRQKVYDEIHHRCGTMRVLDMEQPIGIGDIYTKVNILEKLSGRRRLQVMIEHRNIGYDWRFTDAQTEKLQKYYDANKLLVDCINSDCYVTKATRQYIEDTLLLPMSEIDKKNAEYGIQSLRN